MELERISVVLRPRLPREALDLGVAMLRANAGAVWKAWFVFTLPIFVLCNAFGLLLGLPWLGLLLVWWLKPLFDRLPLYVLSRAVFAQAPSWREALRGHRQWGWRSTLAGLTWLRLDSHRALRLPLDLLEGASRQQRAARWKVLRRRIAVDTSLLTLGCLQFELVLFLSVPLFGLLLLPQEWQPASLAEFFRGDLQQATTMWTLVAAAAAYLAMSVIEPLYVACGFALYLNRRTQLEAWDVDLAFRGLRERLQGMGKVVGLVLLCAVAGTLPVRATSAQAVSAGPAATRMEAVFEQPLSRADADFAEASAEIYRDPRFAGEHSARRWVLKHPMERKRESEKLTPHAPAVLPGQLLSGAFKGVLWLLLIGVVGALIWFAWRTRGRWAAAPDQPSELPGASRQTCVKPAAPLPADLAAATRALWQARQRREALALLYRGCVEQTAQLLQLPPSEDATEADWLRQAAAIEDPARAQRVVAIVRAWQFAAYAGRYPDDATIENLLDGWPVQAGASA